MEREQRSFAGGMNVLDADTAIQEDQYLLCINGRSRFGQVEPVAQAILQTGLPVGNYQGGISVGSTTIVFVNGKAYYQLYGSISWLPIPNFQMDAIAPRLWAIAIPKSNANFVRKSVDSLNQPIVINADVNISGTPAGILVQDNINQPWLIEFNQTAQQFTSRVTKNFTQWTNVSTSANDREYVPIGNMMFFVNQKLFIARRDKKALYQSVTGRPLDFMLNIDSNGNKLASELQGGADTVSFAFDADEITCIRSVNLPDSFVYATARNVRIIKMNYTNTILGEPTYGQAIIIEAGVVNQESLLYSLGDYLFVDNDGIKSFNAVENLQTEGRNSIFSAPLAKYFKGKVQAVNAAIKFDNYALFYCSTTLGNVILVYDELRQRWDSIDITTVTHIKQFVVLSNGLVNKLFAVCATKVWLMYSDTTNEFCSLFFAALTPDNGKIEHKGQYVKPIFRGGTNTGAVRMIEYVDEQLSATLMRDLAESVMGVAYPVIPPIIPSTIPNMKSPTFIFKDGLVGKKIAYVMAWNTNAALQAIKTVTSEQDGDASSRQVGDTNPGPQNAIIVHPVPIVNYSNTEQSSPATYSIVNILGPQSNVTIPAGTYVSTISQLYVDQLAQNAAATQALGAFTGTPLNPMQKDARLFVDTYVDGMILNPGGDAPTLTPVVWDGTLLYAWSEGDIYGWFGFDKYQMDDDMEQPVMDGNQICNVYLTFVNFNGAAVWTFTILDNLANVIIRCIKHGGDTATGYYENDLTGSQAVPATLFIDQPGGVTTILGSLPTLCMP